MYSVLAIGLAVSAISSGHPSGTAAPTLEPTATAARLLVAHNRERSSVGVPPLVWDENLAAGASAYAARLAEIGHLEHSPRQSRPGQKENLWRGPKGYYQPERMVGEWIDEKSFFKPGIFPDVSTTGNWLDVSHYTTLMWRKTTKVGCGMHSTSKWDYLVCRYSPGGNVDGQATF